LAISLGQTGCYGSFKLTHKVHDWNGTVGGDFVNNLVFWTFVIIPVYEVTLFIDGVILNVIEFWSGSNPVSMNENDTEIQVVEAKGKIYEITATKNKFHVKQIKGPNEGEVAALVFNPSEVAWYLNANNKEIKLVEYVGPDSGINDYINIYKPDGTVIRTAPDIGNICDVKNALALEAIDINAN